MDSIVEGREDHSPDGHHDAHQHVDGEEKEGGCIECAARVREKARLNQVPTPPAPSSADDHSCCVFIEYLLFIEYTLYAPHPVLGQLSTQLALPTTLGDTPCTPSYRRETEAQRNS